MLVKKMNTNYRIFEETYADNSYVSVNSFSYKRIKSNLKELLYFYVDLDVYNEDIFHATIYNEDKNVQHSNLIKEVYNICDTNEIPYPSRIDYTGNGYALYWQLQAINQPENGKLSKFYGVSSQLANKYQQVQRGLVGTFTSLGSDYKATDVSRLMRKPGTINPKTGNKAVVLYDTEEKIEFRDLADKMLDYTLEQYNEWLSPTSKQIEFATEVGLKKDIKNLNKLEISRLISRVVPDKPSFKQNEVLLKIGYTQEEVNKMKRKEAAVIISNANKVDSKNYIFNLLDRAFKQGKVKEGNRAYFYYYLAIALKRQQKTAEEAEVVALKYNSKLKMPLKELEHHLKQGFKSDTVNIRKNTIVRDLGLKSIPMTKNRSKQNKLNKVIINLSNNWKVDSKLSVRELSDKYKISKSKLAEIKKELIYQEIWLKIKSGIVVNVSELANRTRLSTDKIKEIISRIKEKQSTEQLKRSESEGINEVSIKNEKQPNKAVSLVVFRL